MKAYDYIIGKQIQWALSRVEVQKEPKVSLPQRPKKTCPKCGSEIGLEDRKEGRSRRPEILGMYEISGM